MKNILRFIKEHFVETIGLIVILVLIVFISYLKMYKKTYVCTQNGVDSGIKVYQKYEIKQKRNNIKSISYKYELTSDNKEALSEVTNMYKEMIKNNSKVIEDNSLDLKYSDNKLILTYKINKKEINDNEMYKSTRHFVKLLKASGFTCK